MKENHIGLAIKRLAETKRMSVERIAEILQIDRQSVYATYKRANVSPKAIEKYATAIGVTVEDVMKESGYVMAKTIQPASAHIEGDSYLMRRLADLEEMVQFLKGQVMEKDSMIQYLRGKPDSVSSAGYMATASFFWVFCTIFRYTTLS